MTIIEPHKTKLQISEFLYIGATLLLFSVLCIFLYNLNVNLKYDISVKEKAIQNLGVVNADFRNELYQKLNARDLDDFVKAHNLIQDKAPDYVEHKALSLNL